VTVHSTTFSGLAMPRTFDASLNSQPPNSAHANDLVKSISFCDSVLLLSKYMNNIVD
jgi:hypothetical protein